MNNFIGNNCYCMNSLGFDDCRKNGCLVDRDIIKYQTQKFIEAVSEEIKKARAKFPHNDVQMIALVEEVGELAKALMDESNENVWKEAVQVATMALRVAVDKDMSVVQLRKRKGLDV